MTKYVLKRLSDNMYLARDVKDGEFTTFQFTSELFNARCYHNLVIASIRLSDLEREGHSCVIQEFEEAIYEEVLDFVKRLKEKGWQPCN